METDFVTQNEWKVGEKNKNHMHCTSKSDFNQCNLAETNCSRGN